MKIALPKGRLLAETAARLKEAGWGLDGYNASARLYRVKSRNFPRLSAKMFHERDIPIQVAIGNYDLGICGSDWIEELMVKYPSSALMKVGSLGYGQSALYVAVSAAEGISTVEAVRQRSGVVRIASEYPNLAEQFALNLRLRRFGVFPLWGAAEAYPPESADLALVCGTKEGLADCGLVPLSRVLGVSACLVANRNSWESKDMKEVVASIYDEAMSQEAESEIVQPYSGRRPRKSKIFPSGADGDIVRLALPDGHQQSPTFDLLSKAGISLDDYPSPTGNRRPATDLAGVAVKVIRPQDMPLQVASGNFDLAVTGRDWLREHLCQFPTSPVKELVDLKSGRVRIVAVVSNDMPVADASDLAKFSAGRTAPLRVASEYINIADKYARDNHLGSYRVVPTWGATEAFLPEDADLLIENTETGGTIARHNLKIIDTLFESTACLIGRRRRVTNAVKRERIDAIIQALQTGVKLN
ncbi:MAG: ATP phosphoribosyltransferase [Deltaproteobacteria bacterium]|nr:ATP phosphoribosyltransferase [Deltaproteobacteria bacterium]